MAFDSDNLSALYYANGFTHWHYKSSSDTLATIMADGYFDDAANMMRELDRITIQARDQVWEDIVWDVVTTAGSEDVAIGIQATDAAVASASARWTVGSERTRYDGAVFKYCTAATNLAAGDWATLTSPSAIVPLDTDVAASILPGAPLGVAMVAMTAASTNTAWVCRKGEGIAHNHADAEVGTRLIATATAGQVDGQDAGGAPASNRYVDGAIQTATDVATLHFPHVNIDDDGA